MAVTFRSAEKYSYPQPYYSVSFESRGKWINIPLSTINFSEAALKAIAAARAEYRAAEESLLRTCRSGVRPYEIPILVLPETTSKKVKFQVEVSATAEDPGKVVFHLLMKEGNDRGWYDQSGWAIESREFFEFIDRVPSILI